VEIATNDETSYIHGRRGGCKDRSFPSEPDLVKKFLSVWLQSVILIMSPLVHDEPNTKRLLVLLVLEWHPVMAI
jgi:hypothetical protein